LDIYLNIAGGLRVSEPAADLAVACALLSALHDAPLPQEAVIFGEIALSGAVRPVSQTEARLKEAEKLGFAAAWTPPSAALSGAGSGMRVTQVEDLREFVLRVFGADHAG
jgi:DNA repair protein RadA/Sms